MNDATDGAEIGILLDLTEYADPERALELATEGCPKAYTQIAKSHLQDVPYLTTGAMAYMAFVSRIRGLHEGVVREIAANNPHAALPLLRAWTEVVTIALYVVRKPDYVEYLLHGSGEGRPGKKSFEAMFHAVKADAEQLRPVYQDLSEYSHFGPLAIWNVHAIDDEISRTTNWTDAPRWRDARHFQIACAQAHELGTASRDCLLRLGRVLVPKEDDVGQINGQ